MRIGIVRELVTGESRVSLAPGAVYELVKAGHEVLVELGAGREAAISDEDYSAAGARIVGDAEGVWRDAALIAKVFGPVPDEYPFLREDLIVMGFLSLAVKPQLVRALLGSRCSAFALETVQDRAGRLPVLAPMSEIAGRLVPQLGAHYLQRPAGGRGILLGGSTGVRPGRVVILGAGIVGSNAARVASGLGAEVLVLDRNVDRLRQVDDWYLKGVTTLISNSMNIKESALGADLLIGAIQVIGTRTPALVDRATVQEMRDGAVIVDVDVDLGGCVETSRPTTLNDPVFVEEGVTHYCVKNVPSAVSVTAAQALSHALLPYVLKIADKGMVQAVNADQGLMRGAVIVEGRVVNPSLASSYGVDYYPLSSVLPLHAEVQ